MKHGNKMQTVINGEFESKVDGGYDDRRRGYDDGQGAMARVGSLLGEMIEGGVVWASLRNNRRTHWPLNARLLFFTSRVGDGGGRDPAEGIGGRQGRQWRGVEGSTNEALDGCGE